MSNEDEIVIEDHELDWSDNDEIVIEDHELDLIYRTDEYTKEKLQSALTHFESDVAFCKSFKESFHGKKKPTLPNFPGHISENIVKFILRKNGDKTVVWNCTGDLFSDMVSKIQVKCFSSDGASTFGPKTVWNNIYFLDTRDLFKKEGRIICYKVSLTSHSEEWRNIKISNKETFGEFCDKGKRPHITWKSLYQQISHKTEVVYDGTIEGIFEE